MPSADGSLALGRLNLLGGIDVLLEGNVFLGLSLFITRNVRTDALFPALALSQYIANRLTK